MRKIFLAFFLFCSLALGFVPGGIPPVQAAYGGAPQLVQIADLQYKDFYYAVWAHGGATGSRLEFKYLGSTPYVRGQSYDAYAFGARWQDAPGVHGAMISAYTNKAGAVSKLTITANNDIPLSRVEAYAAAAVIMGTLGVDDSAAQRLVNQLRDGNMPGLLTIWNAAGNRRIVITQEIVAPNILNLRMTAYNR